MARISLSLISLAVLCASALSQFAPFPGGFGANCKSKGCGGILPGQFAFGADCKSKGCGIQPGPFGPIFFGGACKSKGCPVPPGFEIPGVPTEPLPPAPPVCCTPDGCLNGYRTECVVGALTPRLSAQGYFTASGSCSGRLRKFDCKSAESVCTGNRGRCVFKRCPRRRRPRPSPSRRPRRSRRPRPTPRPKSRPGRKTHPYPPYRMLVEDEEDDAGPVVDTEDRYFQLIDRMINISDTVTEDMLPASARQFGFGACKSKGCGGFGACKSKGCPFGVFPGGPGGGQLTFGGACKSKGCGIVPGPFGPVYFGGACKSKGCPLPPDFAIPPPPGPPAPPTPPKEPKLPPRVPPFSPPGRRDCCFARPCDTQRICRCVLNK